MAHKRTWKNARGEVVTAVRVSFYVDGKKRFRQFSNQRQARLFKERLAEHRERVSAKASTEKGLTVRELAGLWLAACERGRNGLPPLEPETVVFYRGHLDNHILPALGVRSVRGLQPIDIRDFRDDLLAGHLSRRTCKKVLTTLKTMLGFAIERGDLPSDPSHRIVIRMSSRDVSRVEIHSKEEMAAILAAADRLATARDRRVRRTWQRYRPLLLTLVYTGLRISEARGLKRDAVDLRAGTLSVVQRADKRGRIGAPKTRQGTRRIHIPQVLNEALATWLELHNHPLVFPTATGRPISADNIRKRLWQRVQLAAKVRVLTLHATRHFFVSRQIEAGANVKEIAELLGHADEGFTLRVYGHLFRDHDTEKRRRNRAEQLVLT